MSSRRSHPSPRRTPQPNRCRPTFEPLEDRTTPTVTTDFNNGVLTVFLASTGAVGDTATVTGTATAGDAIDVFDTSTATPTLVRSIPSGVTAINVVDVATNAGQAVVFNDSGGGNIIVTGGITSTGIESVDLATTAALRAAFVSVTTPNPTDPIRLDTSVTTTAAAGQSYGGRVLVGVAAVTLDAGAGGVLFPRTVDSDPLAANALVVNATGITNFTGIVGGADPLASLTTDANGNTSLGANVNTTGAQTYNDAVLIPGAAVTAASTGSGNITFASTVNAQTSGTNSLTVNTGGVTAFKGVVGGTPLGGLFTDAQGTTTIAANVTTTLSQNYGDPVTVSGAALTLASTNGGNITFGGTLDALAAAATALTVSTGTGTTTFTDNVGVGTPLLSLTTDAGTGTTAFGTTGAGPRTVATSGAQTFNDAVQVDATSITFSSTANGNLTFGGTLNGVTAGATAAAFNTGGDTTFGAAVGGSKAFGTLTTDNAGQAGEETVVRAGVVTTAAQSYGDAVTVTPATGVTGIGFTSSGGGVAFAKTITGAAAAPVSVTAASDVGIAGNVTFTAAGSRVNVQAGSDGSGAIVIGAGVTVQADVQTWRAGDGTNGAGTAATADLTTNTPAFRDAGGLNAPRSFVFRQDAAITDAVLPTAAQFGGSAPASYAIVSDDGTLTVSAAGTALAGPQTANLTLAGTQGVTLGTAVNAPVGIVRLRSAAGMVTQTGGGITASGLGASASSGVALTGANAVQGTVAFQTSNGDARLTNTKPVTVGTVGADPLAVGFTAVTGVTAPGAVVFDQSDSAPLDVTLTAPVTGASVAATGGAGDDRVTVNYSLGATLSGGLTFTGNAGTDTLTVTDTGAAAAHTYTVNTGLTRDANTPLTYTGVETVSVTGGTAADTFNVTPDATAAVTVAGGLPVGTSGDKLTVAFAGTTGATLTSSKAADGFQGSAAFGNRRTVSFTQMELVSPQADIRVTQSVSPTVLQPGGTTTLTIVVTNLGPDAATGVKITDAFPAGISATWTATASSGSSVAAAGGSGDINTTADLAANGTVTFTVSATANPGVTGTLTNTATADSSGSAFDTVPTNNSAAATFSIRAIARVAVGAGPGGGPEVKAFDAAGAQVFDFFAYDAAYRGGVTVATGDVTGDGVEDIVTGSAQGSSNVKVFDGATGSLVASFFAFPGFEGGVNVAVANGQVAAGAGPGGGPIVSLFRVAGGVAQTASFFAFDPLFRGGVQVGGSDQFLAVGAGPGGGPHVKVFETAGLSLVSSFFAFPVGSSDGVSVAIGNPTGQPTVVVGAGVGASPAAVTFDARTGKTITSVLGFDAAFRGGVRVATTSAADGTGATVVAAGPGGSPRVRVFNAAGNVVQDFFAFDPAFTGGVYVG